MCRLQPLPDKLFGEGLCVAGGWRGPLGGGPYLIGTGGARGQPQRGWACLLTGRVTLWVSMNHLSSPPKTGSAELKGRFQQFPVLHI